MANIDKRLDNLEAETLVQSEGNNLLVVGRDAAGTWVDKNGQPIPEVEQARIRAKAERLGKSVLIIEQPKNDGRGIDAQREKAAERRVEL